MPHYIPTKKMGTGLQNLIHIYIITRLNVRGRDEVPATSIIEDTKPKKEVSKLKMKEIWKAGERKKIELKKKTQEHSSSKSTKVVSKFCTNQMKRDYKMKK